MATPSDFRIVELRPTDEVIELPHPGTGQKARRWIGKTDDGIEVDLYVSAVRVLAEDSDAFEASFGDALVELHYSFLGRLADPREPSGPISLREVN